MITSLQASQLRPAWRAFVRAAYYVIQFVACLSVLVAICQWFGARPWPTYSDYNTGLFYNPIAQGGFLGLAIVASAIVHRWEPVTVMILGLALNSNRGGWVIAAVGLLATRVRQPLVILAVVLAGAAFLTYHLSQSDAWRLAIWYAAWQHLTLLGNGWGSFENIWLIHDGLWYHPEYAHNDYLQLVFELGVFAAIPFALIGWALFQAHDEAWPLLVAYCLLSAFTMPLHIPACAAIGALALTTILARRLFNA